MKNIVVLMHDDDGQEARLQAALDLTRAIDGHLTCVDVAVLPILLGEFSGLGSDAVLAADSIQRELGNRQNIEPRLMREGVPFDWIDRSGDAAHCLEEASRLADLIVLNRALDSFGLPDMQELIGHTIIAARKPVLAVPPDGAGLKVDGQVIVAWDGSRAAEAALVAAVPLLKFAHSVTIIHVDDGKAGVSSEEAALYLSRHGIRPRIREIPAGRERAQSIIMAELSILHPAFVVMGGFGHNRLIERVLGGVTQRLLRDSPVPLFLAH